VLFEILHPPAGASSAKDNATSCVLAVTAPGARLLLPGDIEAEQERELVAQARVARVDLLLAPHHGSRTSSSAPFVAATTPRHVIVPAGYRNRWRFPADEVVARWRGAGACVWNTAEAGALGFEAGDGVGFGLRRAERLAAPGIWLARPVTRPGCR
jgi:competence protein ComEC